MDGWIKLHRKLIDNPIMQKPELLQLFIYCLLKANHETQRIIFNGQEIEIKSGQFITGRNAMAKDLKQNPKSTYNRLQILKNIEILDIKTNNKFSLVTVRNYELYQSQETKKDSKKDNQRTTRGQPEDTNKNDKNDKNNIYGDFFEKCWALYPNKKGKGSISKTKIKKLYDTVGEEQFIRCIERYKKETTGTDKQYIKHGSTFFNSGYVDYLDANYKQDKPKSRYKEE